MEPKVSRMLMINGIDDAQANLYRVVKLILHGEKQSQEFIKAADEALVRLKAE